MNFYKSKYNRITGKTYREKEHSARLIYNEFAKKTKRQPYIKSAYLKKKVFLKSFWNHLSDKKSIADRSRRLTYYACALDLIKNSTSAPDEYIRESETYYRFHGVDKEGNKFVVQIRKDKKDNHYHMSVFPSRHGK